MCVNPDSQAGTVGTVSLVIKQLEGESFDRCVVDTLETQFPLHQAGGGEAGPFPQVLSAADLLSLKAVSMTRTSSWASL